MLWSTTPTTSLENNNAITHNLNIGSADYTHLVIKTFNQARSYDTGSIVYNTTQVLLPLVVNAFTIAPVDYVDNQTNTVFTAFNRFVVSSISEHTCSIVENASAGFWASGSQISTTNGYSKRQLKAYAIYGVNINDLP